VQLQPSKHITMVTDFGTSIPKIAQVKQLSGKQEARLAVRMQDAAAAADSLPGPLPSHTSPVKRPGALRTFRSARLRHGSQVGALCVEAHTPV